MADVKYGKKALVVTYLWYCRFHTFQVKLFLGAVTIFILPTFLNNINGRMDLYIVLYHCFRKRSDPHLCTCLLYSHYFYA